jgi:transcriptional regulator with XRE-family HTH domain
MKLAKVLVDARTKLGISLREAARRMDYHPGCLSAFESGKSRPSEKRLRRICAVLDIDFDIAMKLMGVVPSDVQDYITRTPGVLARLRKEMLRSKVLAA